MSENIENNTNLLIKAINNENIDIINQFIDKIIFEYCHPEHMQSGCGYISEYRQYMITYNIYDAEKIFSCANENKYKDLFLYFGNLEKHGGASYIGFSKFIEKFNHKFCITYLTDYDVLTNFLIYNKYFHIKDILFDPCSQIFSKIFFSEIEKCNRYSKYVLLTYIYYFSWVGIKIFKFNLKKLKYEHINKHYLDYLTKYKQRYFKKKLNIYNKFDNLQFSRNKFYINSYDFDKSLFNNFNILYHIIKKNDQK